MRSTFEENLSKLYLSRKALDQVRLDKQNALVRRLVRKTQDGTIGEDTDVDEDEDDTHVNIGDQIWQLPPDSGANSKKKTGWLLPTLAAAGLGLGGLGAGLGLSALADKDTPSINIPEDRDTDTQYDIGFFDPDKPKASEE